MDNVDPKTRSVIMKSVKSKGTKLEEKVFNALRKRGIEFESHAEDLLGKPDIVIRDYKIVIFIDSCFWHGCPQHLRVPKSNIDYWQKKIERNKARDKEVTKHYTDSNWYVIRIWEHELKENFENTINNIQDFIERVKAQHK